MGNGNYQPEFGIPDEANSQEATVGRTRKNFADMIRPQIESVSVIYFNDASFDQLSDAETYVGIFLNQRYKHSDVNGIVLWAEGLGYPEIECEVEFNPKIAGTVSTLSQPRGRLIFWRNRSCFRGYDGRWWFYSVGEHFRLHHPENTKKNAR